MLVAVLVVGTCLTTTTREASAGSLRSGLGPSATITSSTSSGSVRALADGAPTATTDDLGKDWVISARSSAWVQFDWSSPQLLTSVQAYGASSASRTIRSANVSFSDGSSVPVGAVLPDPRFPTVVAFAPRRVSWVRMTITSVQGGDDGASTVGLAELRVFGSGTTPPRYADGTAVPSVSAASAVFNQPCPGPGSGQAGKSGVVVVTCPTSVSGVSGTRRVDFLAPGLTRVAVDAWSAEPAAPQIATKTVGVSADGRGQVWVPFGQLPSGPVFVEFTGLSGPAAGQSTPTFFQLVNVSTAPGVGPSVPPPSGDSRGRTLVYDDEFNSSPSVSGDAVSPLARYAAAKPEWWGTGQFGDAIFADPASGLDNIRSVNDRYLRMTLQPRPAGYADPNGWGRSYVGALIGSARAGGSGFSAQNAYWEARILTPAAPGTWPAFWLMPSQNLVEAQSRVAEIDVLEQYGVSPRGGCSTTHSYLNGSNTDGVALCDGNRFSSDRQAMSWHTYGAQVTTDKIIYTVDGTVVATAPQVAGGQDPMFFMFDLDLGGGWPVDLSGIQGRAAMYVDYVRVYE